MSTEMRRERSAESNLPPIPYGAVYFRKSNPPPEDWERDYRTAAVDGMNIFRHWFLWSAIEIAPGEYDWTDYDRQLDLAEANGIRTIIAEMITAAPEWAWRQYAHARYLDAAGRPAHSQMSGSCVTGGFPGLCLDNPDALALAERFLVALATRYRSHPALAGYDVWNECNIPRTYCYCPATLERFREWLREKYGTVGELGRAWYRYSYASWEDVGAPRSLGPYPDVLDWLHFRIDNAYRLMRWRVETIRRLDPDHLIAAHGIASSISDMAPAACDEWRAASQVQTWGFTWVASRKGSEPWKQWHAVDLVRAGASVGLRAGDAPKPFWHAEAQAGPLWMQPQVVNRPREDGRICDPEDVRLWNMISFAGGATGILYPRWRPLLDGPLFGAFGAYGLDGARTSRSTMASQVARWANAPEQTPLWQARPVLGDLGIVVVPETQLFCYAQQGNTDLYAQSARGAYQGFFEHNVQADWVHLDAIDRYILLYLPFPVHLSAETARRLRAWVEGGGTLIAEGLPGYWGDRARVGTAQPNLGLDELFGVRETYVECTPDLLDRLSFEWQGLPVAGGIFLQAYEPIRVGATVAGHYTGDVAGPAAGLPAAVEHRFGKGRTLLFGTFPGYGHFHRPSPDSRRFFASLLSWAGTDQHVRVRASPSGSSVPGAPGEWRGITARLHEDHANGRRFLWVTNPARVRQRASIQLAPRWGGVTRAVPLWPSGATAAPALAGIIELAVGDRDAFVAELER